MEATVGEFLIGILPRLSRNKRFPYWPPDCSGCAWHCSSGPEPTRSFFEIGRQDRPRTVLWMLGRAACEHWVRNGGTVGRRADLLMVLPSSGRPFASHLRYRSIGHGIDARYARRS